MQEPKNERPVVVAGKDQGEVDNDYLLIPVNILDHEGPLSAAFPVENRLLPQGEQSGTQSRRALSPKAGHCDESIMRLAGLAGPAGSPDTRRLLIPPPGHSRL